MLKPFENSLKYLAIGAVAALLIALLANAVLNLRASARLDDKIAALRDAGQPVTLAELKRKPIVPETNAATYLRQAQADVNAIQADVSAARDAAPEADQEKYEEGFLSPELKSVIHSALAAHPELIGLLARAAECPDYDSQPDLIVDSTRIANSIPAMRAAIRVLNYWALEQIADGEPEAALETCLVMFRLCRHFDREPTMLGNLVTVACRTITLGTANRALRTGPVSDASRDALEAELARHESLEPYRYALRTELAFSLERYRDLGRQLSFGPFGLPWIKDAASENIVLFEDLLAQAGQPFKEIEPLPTNSAANDARQFALLSLPALHAATEAHYRIRAKTRALRILNALARHPDLAAGEELNLADLGLPAEVTTDPYDGQPLCVKKLPDGWLVYSVGKNLKDDGGELFDLVDVGLGPPSAMEKPATEDEPKDDAGEPGSH